MIKYDRIVAIDELTRNDHYYLDREDQCFYLGEYTAERGFNHSATNQAILNLKIEPSKPKNRLYYKSAAIADFSREMNKLIGSTFAMHTFVPMPPSKTLSHPDYDDRLIQVLTRATHGIKADIRPLLLETADREAAHKTPGKKRSPDNFNFSIDETYAAPAPTSIIIFDDVLNTGASFCAAKRQLHERFPTVEIMGLFLARCVHEADLSLFDLG